MAALQIVEIGKYFQDDDSNFCFEAFPLVPPTSGSPISSRSRARTNGSTTTFRRPSGANNLSPRSDGTSITNPTSSIGSVYIPPHLNSNSSPSMARNGNSGDTRYTKDQLLDMFRVQQDRSSQPSVEDLFIDGWSPTGTNGLTNGGWGRNEDHKESNGPEICWEQNGGVHPLGLLPLSEEEKEVRNCHSYHILAAYRNRHFPLL